MIELCATCMRTREPHDKCGVNGCGCSCNTQRTHPEYVVVDTRTMQVFAHDRSVLFTEVTAVQWADVRNEVEWDRYKAYRLEPLL